MYNALNEGHIQAAGRSLKVITDMCGPEDAQVALMLMVCYLCVQFDLNPMDVLKTFGMNMRKLLKNDELTGRVSREIYSILNSGRISVPVGFSPSAG